MGLSKQASFFRASILTTTAALCCVPATTQAEAIDWTGLTDVNWNTTTASNWVITSGPNRGTFQVPGSLDDIDIRTATLNRWPRIDHQFFNEAVRSISLVGTIDEEGTVKEAQLNFVKGTLSVWRDVTVTRAKLTMPQGGGGPVTLNVGLTPLGQQPLRGRIRIGDGGMFIQAFTTGTSTVTVLDNAAGDGELLVGGNGEYRFLAGDLTVNLINIGVTGTDTATFKWDSSGTLATNDLTVGPAGFLTLSSNKQFDTKLTLEGAMNISGSGSLTLGTQGNDSDIFVDGGKIDVSGSLIFGPKCLYKADTTNGATINLRGQISLPAAKFENQQTAIPANVDGLQDTTITACFGDAFDAVGSGEHDVEIVTLEADRAGGFADADFVIKKLVLGADLAGGVVLDDDHTRARLAAGPWAASDVPVLGLILGGATVCSPPTDPDDVVVVRFTGAHEAIYVDELEIKGAVRVELGGKKVFYNNNGTLDELIIGDTDLDGDVDDFDLIAIITGYTGSITGGNKQWADGDTDGDRDVDDFDLINAITNYTGSL